MSGDAALDDLHKAGDDRVRAATADDSIGGVAPAYVAAPVSTDETAELLRVAANHGLHVSAHGSGTRQDWANPPVRLDLVIDTTAMSGVVEHAAGDLIAVVRAGTTMADLASVLAEAGQEFAIDAANPSATIGGTVATNASGPRRLLYGTMRDLLIGITFVRADGVVARAGGRVVKNVAGYDFGKLLTGSYGTLGVITEVIVRLHPLPRARRFVVVDGLDADSGAAAALRVLRSQVVPAAIEVDRPANGGDQVGVAVLVEGVEAGVETRAEAAADLLGAGAEVRARAPAWFGAHPFGPGDVGLKITTALTGVGPLLALASELETRCGLAISVRGSAAGVLYAAVPDSTNATKVAALVQDLRAGAARFAGSLVVLTAPAEIRAGLDTWGPVSGLDLMRRLKDQLDPDHRLSPGRFVGGI